MVLDEPSGFFVHPGRAKTARILLCLWLDSSRGNPSRDLQLFCRGGGFSDETFLTEEKFWSHFDRPLTKL
jgi:hypothetical protein